MDIIGPTVEPASDCEAVLRTLPAWFGIEHALLMYARDSALMPTFALVQGPQQSIVGFLTLHEHFVDAWETHCIAISSDARGKGLGSRLLTPAESWLIDRGVQFLQVKTVAATSPFLQRCGTRNPALQCIKVLR